MIRWREGHVLLVRGVSDVAERIEGGRKSTSEHGFALPV